MLFLIELLKNTIKSLYSIRSIYAHRENIHREINEKHNKYGIYFSKKQVDNSLKRLVFSEEVKSEEKNFPGKKTTVYMIVPEKEE